MKKKLAQFHDTWQPVVDAALIIFLISGYHPKSWLLWSGAIVWAVLFWGRLYLALRRRGEKS